MKIIAWNIRNVGSTKLTRTFSPPISAAGMGNNVGDYIVRVVTGQAPWNGVNTPGLPDVFVIIELKTGGHVKGRAANGASGIVLANLVAAMNTVANAGLVPPATNPLFQYASVPAQVVGRHECVGIIYNTRSLTLNQQGVLRDDVNNRYILPRTPYWAEFTEIATGTVLNVVGIHAPPPSGGALNYYRPGIRFANSLTNSNQLDVNNQMQPENTFVMGDFNCDPTSMYGFPAVQFNMPGYATSLPANTLSSVRQRVANLVPPRNYLSDAFDNVMHAFPNGAPGAITERVLDLIGNAPAPLYPNSVRMLVNNYGKVSDHLPVLFEY